MPIPFDSHIILETDTSAESRERFQNINEINSQYMKLHTDIISSTYFKNFRETAVKNLQEGRILPNCI